MKIYTYELTCRKCEKTFLYSRNTPKGPPRKECFECHPVKPPSKMKLVSVTEQE